MFVRYNFGIPSCKTWENYGKRISDVLEFAASGETAAELVGEANPATVSASLRAAIRRLEGRGRLEAGVIKVATRNNRIFLYRT